MPPVYGWLAPDNELYITRVPYNHLILLWDKAARYFSYELCSLIESAKEIEEECRQAAENDEPIEWHRFATAESEANHLLQREILDKDFIRLGTSHSGWTLYYQSAKPLTNDKYLVLKDLAEANDIRDIKDEYGRF